MSAVTCEPASGLTLDRISLMTTKEVSQNLKKKQTLGILDALRLQQFEGNFLSAESLSSAFLGGMNEEEGGGKKEDYFQNLWKTWKN